jgi:hypothetical protein
MRKSNAVTKYYAQPGSSYTRKFINFCNTAHQYNGSFESYEDSADYIKIRNIKAVRVA